jgi:hypothetical protein
MIKFKASNWLLPNFVFEFYSWIERHLFGGKKYQTLSISELIWELAETDLDYWFLLAWKTRDEFGPELVFLYEKNEEGFVTLQMRIEELNSYEYLGKISNWIDALHPEDYRELESLLNGNSVSSDLDKVIRDWIEEHGGRRSYLRVLYADPKSNPAEKKS